jgi:two-component system chemotaxis response regulator CheY
MQHTALMQPEPGTHPTALSDDVPARRLTAVEPRARILYVDDEPQPRILGELVLVRSGYDVDIAADGAEAWAALLDENYHLLITEQDMPRLSGLELASRVRRAGMRLPILLTSGSHNCLHDPSCAWLDFAAFLRKPFAPDSLVEMVEQVLVAANTLRDQSESILSSLEHMARRAQPYLHGGINE